MKLKNVEDVSNLGSEHVDESFSRTLESDATEEEDGEDDIGEESCEVDNLARAGDTWEHSEEYNSDDHRQRGMLLKFIQRIISPSDVQLQTCVSFYARDMTDIDQLLDIWGLVRFRSNIAKVDDDWSVWWSLWLPFMRMR